METPVAQIDATHENVNANCPTCGVRNVYNRRSDLNARGPIDNATVACAACSRKFDIVGDLINPTHELLLLDCRQLFEDKRYADVILTAARAHEVFFSHFLHVQLLWRPIGTACGALTRWNDLRAQLDAKLATSTFEPLRKLFLQMVIDQTAPRSYDEARACIDALPKKPNQVARAAVDAVPGDRLRGRLLALYDTTIHQLRNRVVHKQAYRPTREETSREYEKASRILFGLTAELRLRGDANWYINGGDRFDS